MPDTGPPSDAWLRALGGMVASQRFDEEIEILPPIESFFFGNPETVCEPDERTPVRDTSIPPWDANCRLIITMADGTRAVGSGWLMAPKLVVTAGHCVHEGEGGRYFRQVEVIPGCDGMIQPYGSQVSTKLRASVAWRNSGALADDYGAIILDAPFNGAAGAPSNHGILVADDRDLRSGEATVSGYPADKAGAMQWQDSDPFSHILKTRLRYLLDTYGGQSGSGVMHQGRVVGIHNYGGCPNYATRITTQVEAQLNEWLAESNR